MPARAGAHWNLGPNVVPTKTDPPVCGVMISLSKSTPPTHLPVSSSTRHWKPSCEKIQHHLRCFQGSPIPWKIKFLSEVIQTFREGETPDSPEHFLHSNKKLFWSLSFEWFGMLWHFNFYFLIPLDHVQRLMCITGELCTAVLARAQIVYTGSL